MELNLKSKKLVFLAMFFYASASFADPEIGGELLPPGEAMYVTDESVLQKLNLGPVDEPVWCYSSLANSLLITAHDRQKELCALRLSQLERRLTLDFRFEVEQLNIQLSSQAVKHAEVLLIKERQIDDLTAAALKRPNDYSAWWATGGAIVGSAATLVIVFAVMK